MTKGLVWFRRDLRLNDHPALQQSLDAHHCVYTVFVFDPAILDPVKKKSPRDHRVTFIAESILELDKKLRTHGGGLILAHGNPRDVIPMLIQTLDVDTLYFNRDYSPYAVERDTAVLNAVSQMGRKAVHLRDHVMFEPEEILNQTGKAYHVFTPYSVQWRLKLEERWTGPRPTLRLNHLAPPTMWPCQSKSQDILHSIGFEPTTLILPGGENHAQKRLNSFVEQIENYGKNRDAFAHDGTSKLSVYLRHGCISIRDMVNITLSHPSDGAEKWQTELIWREFYQMVMHFYPDSKTQAFQPKYHDLEYPTDERLIALFKSGQTGFPIIDAAMRCLNTTGWMHNRLRMVVASFFSKILLCDWRRGERYFSWKLLDYELQSNVGGWQWAAGVGCDAAPYFRIFNPMTQSQKYDPSGNLIREFCPELRNLNAKQIHAPWTFNHLPGVTLGKDYPKPCVDYASQRKKALELLRS